MIGMLEWNTTVRWFRETARSMLPKGRFARGVTVLAGGAALGQAINVMVFPVLTRLYSPEDFGIFGVFSSILAIAIVVASLRYEYAIILPEDDRKAANVMTLCFFILIGTTLCSWSLLQMLRDQIVTWTNTPGLGQYLWLIPVGMLGAGAYQILNYWTVRKRDFVRIGRTRLTRGVGRALFQVGLGFSASGPLGLLVGQVAGECVGSASLASAALNRDRVVLGAVSLDGIREAIARYRRFPIFSGTADLIDTLGLNAPQILFAAFYGADVAGWFALGQRVIAAPLNIVVDSVSQVYFGEAARLPRDDHRSMRRLFLKLTGRLALMGAIPVALICALAPWFFAVVFGQSWETAGRYVQILGVMFAVRFAVVPLQHTLNILERQDLYFAWDSARLVMVVGAMLTANAMGFSHIGAVAAYSVAMSAAYVLFWLIGWNALTAKRGIQESKEI
ncbi:MAG: oligosaccharide flippase family protein [Methanothrix sp.]|uniref:lipopolysaccharide biosynthesis protein n=1 Tax=Methanothrix sp. TaxID=90426 RepID=UPI0032AEFE84|nr:oligosaccharide flippase family protein [Methanothrix sp.]